jgi:hypothetical protein
MGTPFGPGGTSILEATFLDKTISNQKGRFFKRPF